MGRDVSRQFGRLWIDLLINSAVIVRSISHNCDVRECRRLPAFVGIGKKVLDSLWINHTITEDFINLCNINNFRSVAATFLRRSPSRQPF